jgi:hypothetical protein
VTVAERILTVASPKLCSEFAFGRLGRKRGCRDSVEWLQPPHAGHHAVALERLER